MLNKVKEANPYGSIDINELSILEKKIGISLPEDYRKYLINNNGAEFERDVFLINEIEGESRIHHMRGILYEPQYASLFNYYKIYNQTLNEKFLSIAEDAFGNQILLKLKDPDRGAIYFWDHEVHFKSIEEILIKLSNSFTDFVNSLTQNETQEEFLEKLKQESPEHYQLIINAMKERGDS